MKTFAGVRILCNTSNKTGTYSLYAVLDENDTRNAYRGPACDVSSRKYGGLL